MNRGLVHSPVATIGLVGIVLPALLLAACSAHAGLPAGAPAPTASATTGEPCPEPPPCGSDCRNHPFEATDCWTTQYGPAKANIIVGNALKSTNMLYCDGGAYALCFFSGPPQPTGDPNAGNAALPCTLDGDIAHCTCQVYISGPYFVDINSILNLGAYYETVETCGHDGSSCANIVSCGQDGSQPGCAERTPPPVCKYIAHQNPNEPLASLIPKADLISAFSFAMDDTYTLGSKPCTGLYAGCMTAPCSFPTGKPASLSDGMPVQCDCPTYSGDYQVGQSGQECSIPGSDGVSYVWSAASSVAASQSPEPR